MNSKASGTTAAAVSKPSMTQRGGDGGGGGATGNGSRAPQTQQRHYRLACVLAKANELQRLRRSFGAWHSFLHQRQQQVHLKRCAVALQHSNGRSQYTRLFVRWLAAAQQSASQEAKDAYEPPRVFPLRTKNDVLFLVSRYFNMWRRHSRRQQQRTRTNVELLAQVNRERAQRHVLTAWLLFQQRRKHQSEYQKQCQDTEAQVDALTERLKSREGEVALLQTTLERAVTALNGNPTGAKGSPVEGESPKDSFARTKTLTAALEGALEETALCGAEKKPPTASEPLSTRLRAMERGLADAEAAKQQARENVENLNALLAALTRVLEADRVAAGEASAVDARTSTASSSPQTPAGSVPPTLAGSPAPTRSPAVDGASQSGSRGSVLHGGGSSSSRQPSPRRSGDAASTTTASAATLAKVSAQQVAKELADCGNDLPLRLLDEVSRLVASGEQRKQDLDQRADEVVRLRDAALRAIDSLGGRRANNELLFTSKPDDTVSQSVKRSADVASTLSDLCEDLVVVLVLASLWSQGGVNERVSESLERMWRELGQAEKDLQYECETAEEVMRVVTGAAALLGGGAAGTERQTDQLLESAKAAARSLREAKKQPAPQQLLDCCLELNGARVSEVKSAEEQRRALAEQLEAAKKELATLRERETATANELERTTQQLADSGEELRRTREALLAAQSGSEKARRDAQHTADTLTDAESRLADTQRLLQEGNEAAEGLQEVLDGVAAMLDRPDSGEAHEAATRAAERAAALAENTDSATPTAAAAAAAAARCLQLLSGLTAKVHNALEGLPESVASACALGPASSLEDQVGALCEWRDELLRDMKEAIQINDGSEAIAAFLRDVLRDVMHRLVHLREGCGDEDSMLSTKVSLALDPDEPPRPLTRGDPSQYVQYILTLQSMSERSKNAVQDHLAGGAVLGSEGEAGGHAGASPPSTWDVIADVHENLAAVVEMNAKQGNALEEQKELAEQLSRANGVLRESLDNAQNALRNWSDAAAGPGEQAPLLPPPPPASNSLVTDFHAEVEAVVEALRQLQAAAQEDTTSGAGHPAADDGSAPAHETAHPQSCIRDLASLVGAVESMRRRLVELQSTAEDGIVALGGDPAGARHEADSGGGSGGGGGGGGGGGPGGEQSLAERLAAICRDTGASIGEAKEILGIPQGEGKRLTLRDMLPNIQSKIHELEEVRRDSEAFVHCLDTAFNGDGGSSPNSSLTSTMRSSKNLKPKKKPLPALEGSPTELISMTHREFSPLRSSAVTFSATAEASPQARIQAIRTHALEKIDEVQELHTACRTVISILDGSYVEGQKPRAYGNVLIPLLLSQVEDIKKAIPQCNEVLKRNRRAAPNGDRKMSIAAKLSTLAQLSQSLEMECNSLRGEVAGKGRQNVFLLEDIDAQAELHKSEEQAYDDLIEQLRAENANLKAREEALGNEREVSEVHQRELDAEVQRLTEAVRRLDESLAEETALNNELTKHLSQRQHDNNVLTNALAKAVLSLTPPSPQRQGRQSGGDDSDGDRDADERAAHIDALGIPRLVADVEPFLLQKLAINEGAPLQAFVRDYAAAVRDCWNGPLDELQRLRGDLQALRGAIASAWETEFKPYCTQLLAAAEEDAERLQLENKLLRPRAVEREVLLRENEALLQRLADAEADLAAAEEDVQAQVDANSELRKALRVAQVEQVIRSVSDKANGPSSSAQHPSVDVAELERRMVRGATALTMEAIDAIADENLAHLFGDVAARTVNLFRGVEQCLRAAHAAFRGVDQGHRAQALAASVGSTVRELEKLSDAADELWSRVPLLFQVPYRAGAP